MKTPPSDQRDEAIQNFRLCLDVMSSLRELYWEANTATAWALRVIQKVAFTQDLAAGAGSGSAFDCRFRERSSSSDISLTETLGTGVPVMSVSTAEL